MSTVVLVLLPGRSTIYIDSFTYPQSTAWSHKLMYQNEANTDKETGRQPRANTYQKGFNTAENTVMKWNCKNCFENLQIRQICKEIDKPTNTRGKMFLETLLFLANSSLPVQKLKGTNYTQYFREAMS